MGVGRIPDSICTGLPELAVLFLFKHERENKVNEVCCFRIIDRNHFSSHT